MLSGAQRRYECQGKERGAGKGTQTLAPLSTQRPRIAFFALLCMIRWPESEPENRRSTHVRIDCFFLLSYYRFSSCPMELEGGTMMALPLNTCNCKNLWTMVPHGWGVQGLGSGFVTNRVCPVKVSNTSEDARHAPDAVTTGRICARLPVHPASEGRVLLGRSRKAVCPEVKVAVLVAPTAVPSGAIKPRVAEHPLPG